MTVEAAKDRTSDLEKIDNEALVHTWVGLDMVIRTSADKRGRIEHELTRRLEADDATVLAHPTHTVAITPGKPTWDYSRLAALRELLPESEIAKAYTPAHEQLISVPERWDGTKLRTLRKFGREVAEAIDRARLEARGRLSIKAKVA